jgi:uncharacterized protein with von Willebrand factor type A (vWA) domain
MLHLTDEQRARLDEMRNDMDLEELLEKLQEKLEKQQEEHHGGSEHIGTGGTSPFGHSGYHPGGIRIGGEGRWKSAIQTAGDRQWRDLRTDTEIGVSCRVFACLEAVTIMNCSSPASSAAAVCA